MDEDGASAPGHARPGIVIDFDHEIIEVIGAPQAITGGVRLAANRMIVAAITRILAPCVLDADGADRQQRFWPRTAIGPPPQPYKTETAARRCAIALAFVGLDALAPERHRNMGGADHKPALASIAGSGADVNVRYSCAAHGRSHSYHRVGIALIHLESTIDDSFASERALNYRRAHFTDLGGIGVHPLALTIC